MSHYILECKHFPGAHDYANIIEKKIEFLASDWGIDIKLDAMNIPRLACVGHTLNLTVQNSLAGVPRVAGAVAR